MLKANPFRKVFIEKNYQVWKNNVTMQIAIKKRESLRIQNYDNEKEYQEDVEKWENRKDRLK